MDEHKENQDKPTTGTGHGHHEQQLSSSELMSEAKYLAESAQQGMRGETGSIDKSRLAGAADNVLEATSKYGNLDDKAGVGQYVDKAQGYLHQYSGGHSTAPRKEAGNEEGEQERVGEAGSGGGGGRHKEEEEKKEEESESGGGGVGGYAKMATGFMKKF